MRLTTWRMRSTLELDIARDLVVGRGVTVESGFRTHTVVRIGAGCSFGDRVRLRLSGGVLALGDDVEVRADATLSVAGGRLTLAGPNMLSWGVAIHCADSVHLSKFAYMAEYATIADNSHYYSAPGEWSYHNNRTAPVVIEDDVWLCAKSTVTKGVTIGHHTIVAANTVVVKSTPSGVLVSGIPGEVVRELDLPWLR